MATSCSVSAAIDRGTPMIRRLVITPTSIEAASPARRDASAPLLPAVPSSKRDWMNSRSSARACSETIALRSIAIRCSDSAGIPSQALRWARTTHSPWCLSGPSKAVSKCWSAECARRSRRRTGHPSTRRAASPGTRPHRRPPRCRGSSFLRNHRSRISRGSLQHALLGAAVAGAPTAASFGSGILPVHGSEPIAQHSFSTPVKSFALRGPEAGIGTRAWSSALKQRNSPMSDGQRCDLR